MQRPPSTMTAEDLRAWRERHGHSLASGAEALGVSRDMFAKYLGARSGIPRTIALFTAALDRIAELEGRS